MKERLFKFGSTVAAVVVGAFIYDRLANAWEEKDLEIDIHDFTDKAKKAAEAARDAVIEDEPEDGYDAI